MIQHQFHPNQLNSRIACQEADAATATGVLQGGLGVSIGVVELNFCQEPLHSARTPRCQRPWFVDILMLNASTFDKTCWNMICFWVFLFFSYCYLRLITVSNEKIICKVKASRRWQVWCRNSRQPVHQTCPEYVSITSIGFIQLKDLTGHWSWMYFLPVLNLLFVLSVHINFIISKIWHRNWKSLAQHLAFTLLFTKPSFLVTNFAEDLNFGRADPVVRRLLSFQMCNIKLIKSQKFECPTLATWINFRFMII